MRTLLKATLVCALSVGLTGCFFDAADLDERRCLNDQACIARFGQDYRCLNANDDDGGYCIVFQEKCDDPLNGEAGDAFCDDGIFCNGDEVCDPDNGASDAAGCLSVSRDLSDGIECTEDHCDEVEDVVVHLDHACECSRDGGDRQCGVLHNGPCVAAATCNPETLACDVELKPEGTDCDDGRACTTGTSCDALGACGGGGTDDAACDDDVFCNGTESCAPGSADANADGCIAGTRVSDDPAFDDGNDCTQTFCEEDGEEVVHSPTLACECRTAADCQAADPADACVVFTCDESTGFTCQREEGMFLTEGPCNDGVACTANDTCQPNGTCSGQPSAAFCSIQTPGAVCSPEDPSADNDGCLAQ